MQEENPLDEMDTKILMNALTIVCEQVWKVWKKQGDCTPSNYYKPCNFGLDFGPEIGCMSVIVKRSKGFKSVDEYIASQEGQDGN